MSQLSFLVAGARLAQQAIEALNVPAPEAVVASAVVDAINGTTPGPASGITYDLKVNAGAAGGTFLIEGVAPHAPRMPDDIDVDAIPVGRPVLLLGYGSADSRTWYWLAPVEMPAAPEEACPEEEEA